MTIFINLHHGIHNINEPWNFIKSDCHTFIRSGTFIILQQLIRKGLLKYIIIEEERKGRR